MYSHFVENLISFNMIHLTRSWHWNLNLIRLFQIYIFISVPFYILICDEVFQISIYFKCSFISKYLFIYFKYISDSYFHLSFFTPSYLWWWFPKLFKPQFLWTHFSAPWCQECQDPCYHLSILELLLSWTYQFLSLDMYLESGKYTF